MEYVVTTPSQLGQVLQGCRKQRGSNQTEVGARVGLRQKAVSTLETDPSRTSVERLFKMLSALDLQIVLRDKRRESVPIEARRRTKAEW